MAIGLHVQMQPDLTALLARSKPDTMLYFNPAEHIPWKAPLTIGRIYVDNQQTLLATDPVGLGNRMANEAISSAKNNGIELWCGPNEPDVGSPEAIYRICICEKIRVQRLNAAGLKAAVFSFSVGWPRENMATRMLDTALFQPFMDWLPQINIVTFHEYWLPSGPLDPASYDPLHPSKIWRFKYWPWPHKIVVTECGIDIAGRPLTDGWKCQVPPGQSLEQWANTYSSQLHQYAQLISADERLTGSPIVFTVGPGAEWGNYDILTHWPQFIWLWENIPQPPTPEPPPGGGDPMASVFLPVDERIPETLRAHKFVDGKVMGSVVRIVAADEAWKRWGHTDTIKTGAVYWKINSMAFINEDAAGGNVAIYLNYVDENGAPVPGMQMWLAWPSDNLERANWIGAFDCGPGGNGETHIYPLGGGEVTMGPNFTNVTDGSTRIGPYIVAAQQDGPSEVAAGFGLPNNRHVCYAVQFKRAKWGSVTPGPGPDPEPEPEPGVTDWHKLAVAARAFADSLDS